VNRFLCLTFDYEVFLGRNLAGYDDVLFEPTRQLLMSLGRRQAKATFFADVCSVWAHQRINQADYPDKFGRQLRDAIHAGHDVQLHVHPHWEYATFHDGMWTPNPQKMILNQFIEDGTRPLGAILADGIHYLNHLLQPIRENYQCNCFRAPGLALQPRESEILASLLEAGIRLDSSIAKGYHLKTDYMRLNYDNCPTVANWRVNPDTGIRKEARAGIWEVPIVTFSPGVADRLYFLFRRVRHSTQTRGFSISASGSSGRVVSVARLVTTNLRYFSPRTRFLLSTDTKGFSLSLLMDGLRQYFASCAGSDVVCAAVIGHPKLLFAQQLCLLEDFIERSRDELGVTYITLSDALRVLDSVGAMADGPRW
jgi:hypothetical protein